MVNKIFYWFKDIIKGTDKLLLGLCLILSCFGILMVYSATRVKLTENAIISRDAKTMIIAIVMGILLCLIVSLFDYDAVARLWPIIAIICLGLMVSLFFFGRAPDARSDAKSWLKFGSFYFQPSELLKIGFIITFSVHLDAVKNDINKISNVILLGIHAMIAVGLVILTGDLGSALVFIVMTLGMLFTAGLYLRYFLFGIGAVALVSPIIWFEFLSDFQKQRFMAIYSPGSLTESTYNEVIYQQQQGLNAIGSGKIFGEGLFNGTYTQSGLVPESENDMIFSVVGEELGFIGCIALLLLLLLVVIKIIFVGQKAVSLTGKLICSAVAIMLATQVLVNIGMCLKLLPVVGITLPFMSAGGSSNLCVYIAVGMVLSVYRSSQFRKPVDFKYGKLYTPFSDTY
jgi:rod shape determining protein RodA